MYYLACVFDYRCNPHKPLYAASYNDETSDVGLYQLFFGGVKFSLKEAYENKLKLKDIITNNTVVLSDFKSYIACLGLDSHEEYEIYDSSLEREPPAQTLVGAKKQALISLQKLKKVQPAKWQKALAKSLLVYSHLEKTGYYHNYKRRYSSYDLAYSGRSKCAVSNIQGATEEDVIEHINEKNTCLVHFDWIAADFRVASLISGDEVMQQSFETSDPYTVLYEALDDKKIDRDECKLELFRSLYSLDYENPALEFFPDFAEWMQESVNKIEIAKFSESLLGRKFFLKDEERMLRSVFNAQVQGSVAHAMQNVLYHVYKKYPNNILAEIHDSLILACEKEQLTDVIREVSEIMLYPMEGMMESNPKFPLKVSVGLKWKQWKPYKEYR